MKLAKFALVIAAGVMMNSGAANACTTQKTGVIGSNDAITAAQVKYLSTASNAPKASTPSTAVREGQSG